MQNTKFDEMNLPKQLIARLEEIKFHNPTRIQSEAIPLALEGKDILGSAHTGTGKTGAFSIPLVAKLISNDDGISLIITPTRELARQVLKQIELLIGNDYKDINTALLIGGEPMPKQLRQLRNNPRVIVGTPGRINDHLSRRKSLLQDTNYLVLDETDLMLDMGFSIQIDKIVKHIPKERQTLLFSATLPEQSLKIANKYLTDPVKISVGPKLTPTKNIKQENLMLKEEIKFKELITQVNQREGSIIVFLKTKFSTERIAKKISKHGHLVDVIHGDLRQNKRDRVIAGFRNQKYRILVATDVAARGLDIPHIRHVINYDMPQDAESYVHRIGRTARAGADGSVLNLICPADKKKWHHIERYMNHGPSSSKSNTSPSGRNRKRKPFNRNKKPRFHKSR